MAYTLNGVHLGTAFSNVDFFGSLFPALSLERGETVRVNLGERPFQHQPASADFRGIAEFWSCRNVTDDGIETSGSAVSAMESAPVVAKTLISQADKVKRDSSTPPHRAINAGDDSEKFEEVKKSVDVHSARSSKYLEALGLDRLKDELVRRSVKCGGTLSERAERLYQVIQYPENEIPSHFKVKAKRRRRGGRK